MCAYFIHGNIKISNSKVISHDLVQPTEGDKTLNVSQNGM